MTLLAGPLVELRPLGLYLPLLLGGHKFSLRVYCVYFSSNEAYIAMEGLVKLAEVALEDQSSLEASTSRNLPH